MRKTDLNSVLFPVEMRPIQFFSKEKKPVMILSHNVVVNLRNETPVGVVSSGYRLVANEEAVRFAEDCARQVFGTEKASNLEIFNVYAPKKGWCCHIDLIHKGFEVNFFKQEVYLPFIRVTNSYNATRALRFDVGFCRKLCLNGVIFEKEAIQFKFTHSHTAIRIGLSFQIEKGKLEALRKKFKTDADHLHNYSIPEGMGVALFFKSLALPLPMNHEKLSKEKQQVIDCLLSEAGLITKKYFENLGSNAYAIFNAITEFASHPPEIKYFRRSPHSMQTMAGTWLREFADKLVNDKAFNLKSYLGEYYRITEYLN